MNYKEKYEQALERAKKLQANAKGLILNKWLYGVFPELKESENEKIRKEILDCFKTMKQQGCFPSKHKEQYDSWITWLENEGKVKHTCRNCQTFQDLHQNCPYSPIYQYINLTEAHKHLDDKTNCEFWTEKQCTEKSAEQSEEDALNIN